MNFQHIRVCFLVDYFALLICFSILKPIAYGQKDYIFIISQYLSVKPFPSFFFFFSPFSVSWPFLALCSYMCTHARAHTHTHTHTHTHQHRIWIIQLFSSVQSLSCVRLFATPWIAAHQASLSILTPGVHSNSRPSSWWCHPAISSSVVHFSSCPQSFPTSESFPMSQLFA